MKGKRVLIGPSSFGSVDQAPLRRLRELGAEVIQNSYGRKFSKDELCSLLPGVVGLIAGLEPLSRDVLASSQLKVISRCGVGTENVDMQAAKELEIQIKHTPDAPTNSVAELTIGAMISLMRHITQLDRSLREGKWSKQIGAQIEGKTIAIIGFGRIGQKVAHLLQPFGARIFAVDPALEGVVNGIPIVSLNGVLSQADMVTLHASGAREILGDREFSYLKKGVFLMNAGRGGLVNEACLCRALKTGAVSGAWIDTFTAEPYAGPLTNFPQVILTPHIGSYTAECRKVMEMDALENLLEAFRELSSNQ